ncbi:phosphate ABC transporter substrate-binding protein PstS family protein [Planctomicrobium piriforme]|uniref:Phosphate-binding protein n=1 Tax=Planctomicrobium piriforme TaxID=1576369 RepID=A0A1I3LX81_9PLAN|nr:phosphate ABC transporter substrate-binding protein PstS family protein [Planctomicrobium piriforme]SFI89391.1 phosphate binding protein [Planctomicrobium piriforme]
MRCNGWLLCGVLGLLLVGCEPQGKSTSESGSTTGGSGTAAAPVKGFVPEGAIAPSPETIKSGTYKPLSRPLFLYVNKAVLKKPEAIAFLEYYFSPEGRALVGESGYVELDDADYDAQVKLLDDAIKAAGGKASETLNGQVLVDGSSTVAPITTAVAEEFSKLHANVRVPVGTSGTGGGFKKFCSGEIDICDASRGIKDSEKELCQKAGIEYLEMKVGIDGLTIVVNPKADWIAGITVEELKKIWNPESKVQKWSDINPAYPNAAIKLFGPDTDSGTFEYFTEEICGKKGASRSDYQQSGDDNFLVTGVAGDEHALGYFGFAYYIENQGKLKALSVAP